MTKIAIVGAGITGVTTAYSLLKRGYDVTIFDRLRYPAMDTSFANGGQLSASNAEVWNNIITIKKGLKWLFRKDAPLRLHLTPTWHKLSWFSEFVAAIRGYELNSHETIRLALMARENLFRIADEEGFDFNLEKRGILHFYPTPESMATARKVNDLLVRGGLDRHEVSSSELLAIEPTLKGKYAGGFFTPGDATGDIHKFTRGLAKVCERMGATFLFETEITDIRAGKSGNILSWRSAGDHLNSNNERFDATIMCGGVGSKQLASMVGDRVNIYPVKGYSITVMLNDEASQQAAPWVSLLDEEAKIVTSRLGNDRFRVAGTAEFDGYNRDIREERIKPLVKWVERNFPDLDSSACVPWAGLRPMMPDMMPHVGQGKKPRIFYNTGHGHLGWTLSAATAEMLADTLSASVPAKS